MKEEQFTNIFNDFLVFKKRFIEKYENNEEMIDLIDGQKWDLKEITSNRNNAIYTRIRHKKEQAHNFIFDIGKSKLTSKTN